MKPFSIASRLAQLSEPGTWEYWKMMFPCPTETLLQLSLHSTGRENTQEHHQITDTALQQSC